MDKTLLKKSDYLKIKYKFFLNRSLTYFSFLLVPIWIQYTQQLNLFIQSVVLMMYMVFMGSQWYFLGKEIDHRLKIYYRANSSLDRILYRIILGSIAMVGLFNIFAIFPKFILDYIFWIFFVVVGLFYSWPTRGKIIQESMSDQLGELKFLDSFERTILILSAFTFFISLPEIPLFQNIEALKLYFDPQENVADGLWSYLSVLYHPFSSYPLLYNLIWSFHFYFFGIGLFLLSFYCIMRYLFSRRLSMLGVFAVISSWSLSRILGVDYFYSMSTTISVVWVWSLMWSAKSGTYRSGLLTGLVVFYASMINALNALLIVATVIVVYASFFKDQTSWFKRQWLKYNILGAFFSLVVFFTQIEDLNWGLISVEYMNTVITDHIYRKAYFIIAPVGFVMCCLYMTNLSQRFMSFVNLDKKQLTQLLAGIFVVIIFGLFVNEDFINGLSFLWILAFFASFPVEWIFQSITKLRSKRNLIYALYILICLLDSQLENRIRIVGKIFLDPETYKFLIQI